MYSGYNPKFKKICISYYIKCTKKNKNQATWYNTKRSVMYITEKKKYTGYNIKMEFT